MVMQVVIYYRFIFLILAVINLIFLGKYSNEYLITLKYFSSLTILFLTF